MTVDLGALAHRRRMKEPPFTGTVRNRVLQLVGSQARALFLAETVAAYCDCPISSARRALFTLVADGRLSRVRRNGRWFYGPPISSKDSS